MKHVVFERPLFSTVDPVRWMDAEYDLAVYALGFESRAVALAKLAPLAANTSVALGFDYGRNETYDENCDYFSKLGVTLIDGLDDGGFEGALVRQFADLPGDRACRVFFDISCFNRFRLAAIVTLVFSTAKQRSASLVVDFGYSIAAFEPPKSEIHPNTVVGPAHRNFAGWSQGGFLSTATVLGLGYEQDQAMGVVEYLQAGEVWAFAPNSPVLEYKPEVSRANELLLSEIPAGNIVEYDVCAPASVLATLESIVRGLGREHSVVLVPFGPKIFVLCSLIVAAMRPDVAVWRVSQGRHIAPSDRQASGVSVGLRLEFGKA